MRELIKTVKDRYKFDIQDGWKLNDGNLYVLVRDEDSVMRPIILVPRWK